MVEAEEATRQYGDWVLLVVDVRDGGDGSMRVDVVRERLVADPGEAVSNVSDLRGGNVQRDVDGVQERYRRACAEVLLGQRNRPSATASTGEKKTDIPREWPVRRTREVLNWLSAFCTAARTSVADLQTAKISISASSCQGRAYIACAAKKP